MHSADALVALAEGDWPEARRRAERTAAHEPGSLLATALATYLGERPVEGVYDEPTAFEAFIDHGTNPELYRRTSHALAVLHAELRPASVLDVGCGDGRLTAEVVGAGTGRIDLVEPSRDLLDRAVERLRSAVAEVIPHAVGLADFLRGLDPTSGWDLVQSTFALHTTRPEDRAPVLGALATRAPRLVVVEFDVPAFDDGSPEHIRYLADRYERGIAEYRDHPEVVSGFLLPVLVGQLDPARPRYTFEQPIDGWTRLFEEAGFRTSTTPIFDYWWGPAHVISAERDRRR